MYKTILLAIFPIFILCSVSQAATWQVDFKGILYKDNDYENISGGFDGSFTFDDSRINSSESYEDRQTMSPSALSLNIVLNGIEENFNEKHAGLSGLTFSNGVLNEWILYNFRDIEFTQADGTVSYFNFTAIEGINYAKIALLNDTYTTNPLDPTTFKWTSYQVSAVPLPAALPLYGAGMALLGFFGWRRKKRNEGMALSKA